jgi:hypothetical protein
MARLDLLLNWAEDCTMKLSRRQALVTAAAALAVKPAQADTLHPVIVADVRFDANDPAAVVQPAGPATTRIFLRKGPWAVIWYVQAKSPVDGKPFDVVVVERQRWTNLTTERNAVNYTADAFGKTFVLKGHGDFQRWVVSSRAWPLHDKVLDSWNSKGWLLPWGAGPKLKLPTQWGWVEEPAPYTPLARGSLTAGMGTTGLRDEIGPITCFGARYIMDRDDRQRAFTLTTGLAAASLPWHVRGPDGAPLLMDRPGATVALQQYYQNMPAEQVIGTSPGMAYEWAIDNAHRPGAAFMPALLSGLHPFFVEQQIFSACAALNSAYIAGRGPGGLLLDSAQGRDWCWSMRDILLAQALLTRLPQMPWMPSAARFEAILNANLDWALRGMAQPGFGALGMFWSFGPGDGAPNPTIWAAKQTRDAPGIYQGAIPDYLGLIFDWGRRLHGDPRWLKLQILFAQRFQARRVLALGPYVAQPVPVRLRGKVAANWSEVAQWLQLPANIAATRWHRFRLPVKDVAIHPYDTEHPMTLYHGLKLAAETGQAGPEVAAAIALLERQMESDASEMWPAFSMRHAT